MRRALLASLPLLGVAACGPLPGEPTLSPLPPVSGAAMAPARVNGGVGAVRSVPPAEVAFGGPRPGIRPRLSQAPGGGDISLDFADTDIREVVAQILGNILKVDYTIDPSVHGSATLHTAHPLPRQAMLPVLDSLLVQNGATLTQSGGVYHVVPLGTATGSPRLAAGTATAGESVVPLRYASAEALAKVMQPFVGHGARVVAAPGQNALLIDGNAESREALIALVRAFDVNELAGQSYAVLPVASGDAKDFAGALREAFRAEGNGALAGVVRVLPMERIDAVLVVSSQPRYIEEAQRVYRLIDRTRLSKVRSWHVYYLQDSRASDIAYVLQQAFTPDNVTAQPGTPGQTAPGTHAQTIAAGGAPGLGSGGIQPGGIQTGGANPLLSGGILGGAASPAAAAGGAEAARPSGGGPAPASVNPLLGGLGGGEGGGTPATGMRIIPDAQNNAILIYGTPSEEGRVEAMLHKLDILPLQVRIDATIAEVTLNDRLKYGTQFFFKSGGINGILNNATAPLLNPAAAALDTSFPGFIISGSGLGGAPLAISALQAVTTVHVLSSPEIMVLNDQPARLQVGSLVPYLTTTSQSTLSSLAPIINSVSYQPTGVIMQVTPRVNSGGLVTLDISQEVSQVDTTAPTTPGIDSPTFSERSVTSRVVVQDGQTVGLAGLISDTLSRGNQGIPWLKDIPILGLLAGTQDNERTRTELLVLITPHVVHDQRDARALTEDLREELRGAALTPAVLKNTPPTGSADPDRRLRQRLFGR